MPEIDALPFTVSASVGVALLPIPSLPSLNTKIVSDAKLPVESTPTTKKSSPARISPVFLDPLISFRPNSICP